MERRSVGRRLADLFHGRPRVQVGALLAGPVGWLVIGYLGSLALLLIAAFYTVNPVSGLSSRRSSASKTSKSSGTNRSTGRSSAARS